MLLSESFNSKPPLYVVEGKNDKILLQSITNAPILLTHGIGYHNNLLEELKQLESTYTIYLLLDPDGPGEKIRSVLREALVHPIDIYVPVSAARNKNGTKIGIEHVSRETLTQYISQGIKQNRVEMLSTSQMQMLKLTGNVNAKTNRKKLCDTLNIGLSNSKTLRYKLMLYGYEFDTVQRTMEGLN